VLLEALAMAKPIITTDSVGCREAVDPGENGFLVAPRDAEAIADAMVRMIETDEEERIEMGRRSREKAEAQYDERNVIAAYISAVNDALEGVER
jgi:glycosyltransferase involved in cell wall biosynthesis